MTYISYRISFRNLLEFLEKKNLPIISLILYSYNDAKEGSMLRFGYGLIRMFIIEKSLKNFYYFVSYYKVLGLHDLCYLVSTWNFAIGIT